MIHGIAKAKHNNITGIDPIAVIGNVITGPEDPALVQALKEIGMTSDDVCIKEAFMRSLRETHTYVFRKRKL